MKEKFNEFNQVEFSHIDNTGSPKMVDVSSKKITYRTAKAYGKVKISKTLYKLIKNNELKKGPVLETAKIAGILGAKQTSNLIPMCHPLNIEFIDIKFNLTEEYIEIFSEVKLSAKTGAEMEALTAVSITGLTIYDMCKSVDKTLEITEIKLIEKTGGKSGIFKREDVL